MFPVAGELLVHPLPVLYLLAQSVGRALTAAARGVALPPVLDGPGGLYDRLTESLQLQVRSHPAPSNAPLRSRRAQER